MRIQPFLRWFPILLVAALLAAGCSAPAVPAPAPTQPAAPATTVPATAASDLFTDLDAFKTALLQALMDHDTLQLQGWMTSPFLTGGWRADASDSAPEDALRVLYRDDLGAENRLAWVPDADLKALMGGVDPLSFPRSEAGVIQAALVSGWGKDGRDEAILFLARQPDDQLKWQGWMKINGGFSGARLGGIQLYTNAAHGFQIYLPKWAEVVENGADNVMVLAPGQGHPGEGRAAAMIEVQPANGRSVEQVIEQAKADAGPGFDIPPGTALGLDRAMAIVLSGLPGQDVNRQLFVVYRDALIHITFVPDTAKVGKPYLEMEDLYAMITNTFHFTD